MVKEGILMHFVFECQGSTFCSPVVVTVPDERDLLATSLAKDVIVRCTYYQSFWTHFLVAVRTGANMATRSSSRWLVSVQATQVEDVDL